MDAPRTIVAVVGEDSRYDALRRQAIERALADHATLILYDIDAGRDPLESPLPTEWSAEGTDEAVADRLGPDELEAAGRHWIAAEVRAARKTGADAWGWLPSSDDKEALSAYVDGLNDALILVPDDEPDLQDAVDAEAWIVRVGSGSDR